MRAAAVVLLGCAAGAGCVDRRIFITSDPSGARVYLNDQDVGVTPLEVNFTWYGVYDVRVRKEGYEPLVTTREAKAPLYELPPFDLIALAIPGTKRTHIDWNFTLEPAKTGPAALMERADELRAQVTAEGAQNEGSAPSESTTAPATEAPATAPAGAGSDVIEVTPARPANSSSPD